jgi:3-methyl-2-oxobutanoate hydroxymethyltransferase
MPYASSGPSQPSGTAGASGPPGANGPAASSGPAGASGPSRAGGSGSGSDTPRRVTAATFQRLKARGERITMLTAYDYPSARIFDAAGVDGLLVGDSLGMVVLGHDTTVPVTLDDIVHHTRPVVRGAARALVVADLPFMTYTAGRKQAIASATRLVQEGGAQAIKLEGGRAYARTVDALVTGGIPVMGHLGLTPQSILRLGGYRVQGRDAATARALLDDARALEDAGAFALVLELVAAPLAERISQSLRIPTIGIGAGAGCDGQIQVMHDVLGYDLPGSFVPRHAKPFAQLGQLALDAAKHYVADVRAGAFPTSAQSFTMEESVLEALGDGAQPTTSGQAPPPGER